MKSKISLFLCKILLFVIPVLVFFEVLFRLGFYPIITDSTLFDLKTIQIQKHHVKNVKLLAIGSSITLNELKSELIVQNVSASYYNFASWGLQIADIRRLLNSYVNKYHPKYVVICSSVRDFTIAANNSYLNYLNANDLVKYNFPEFFYFNDYHSVHQIIRRKFMQYPLKFDAWGVASLITKPNTKQPPNHDIFPTQYTPGAYKELDTLSAFLKKQGIKLIFIQAPIKKAYAGTDTLKKRIGLHFDTCKVIVEAQGGTYLNYYNTSIYPDSLFVDNYHLTDAAAIILTKQIINDLKKIVH